MLKIKRKLKKLLTLDFYLDALAATLRFFMHRNPMFFWFWIKNYLIDGAFRKDQENKRLYIQNYKSFNQTHPYISASTSIILILAMLGGSLFYIFFKPQKAAAGWWDEQWGYRQKFTVTNSSDFDGTNVPYRVIVDTAALITAGKLQSSGDDIRVTNSHGQIVRFQVEKSTLNTTTTGIWFEGSIDDNSTEDYYVYYGNPSADPLEFDSDVSSVTGDGTTVEMKDGFGYTTDTAFGRISDIRKNGTNIGVNGTYRMTSAGYPGNWWDDRAFTRTLLASGPLFVEVKMSDSSYGNYSSFGTSIMMFDNGYISNRVWMVYSADTPEYLYYYLHFDNDTRNSVWVNGSGTLVNQSADTAVLYESDLGDSWFGQLWTGTGKYGGSIVNKNGSDWLLGQTSAQASYFQTNYSHSEAHTSGEKREVRFGTFAGDGGVSEMNQKGSLLGAYSTSGASEEKSLGPVGYWNFDDPAGVYDQSSSRNHSWHPDFPAWGYRKKITIDHTKVSGSLENFPVLISVTDASLKDTANSGHVGQSDGGDIVFANGKYGEKLSHEIELYTPSTGNLIAWVKVPNLSSMVDTELYVYYGNASVVNQADPENVWDSNYKMVQHLKETSGTHYDSTSNNFDGSVTGANQNATGKVGGADSFDGTDDYVNVGDLTLDREVTVEAWVYRTDLTPGFDPIFYKAIANAVPYNEYSLGIYQTTAEPIFNATTNSSFTAPAIGPSATPLNQWTYLIGTYNGETNKIYVDGTLADSDEGPSGDLYVTHNYPAYIARNPTNPTQSFQGTVDEVRISNVARSAEWIATSYNNQNNPSTFHTFASEETKNATPPTWKPESECVSGGCMYFDGSNDYVNPGADFSWTKDDSFSISFWMKANTVSGNQGLIGKGEAGGYGSTNWEWSVRMTNSTLDFIYWNTSGGGEISLTTTVAQNEWNHFVITYDPTNKAKMYQNSLLVATDTNVTNTLQNRTTPVLFGHAYYTSGTNYYFNGTLDEVKIYNYARGTDQVKADYNSGMAGVSTPKGSGVAIGGSSDKWLTDGLVGWWKMDEASWNGTSGEVVDASGNGNNGTASGGATTAAGKFGNGGSFDGSNDYIPITKTSSLASATSNGTVSLWMKRTSQTNVPRAAFDTNAGSVADVSIYTDLDGPAGAIMFQYGSGSSQIRISSTTDNNVWTHLVATWDSSGGKFYKNGVLVGSNSTPPSLTFAYSNFAIGGNVIGAYPHQGQIDEVRMYNRALSGDEVKKLYDWAPGPVAYLKMDEKTGTTAFDASGYGNNGTLLNSPVWTEGKYGGGLKFDGSTNYVSINSVNVFTKPYTVETWANFDTVSKGTDNAIVGHGAGSVDNGLHIGERSSKAYFGFYGDDLSGNRTLSVGQWYHLSFVYDGSKKYIYVNGVLDASNTSSGAYQSVLTNAEIGRYPWATGNHMDGMLDDVKIYNYVRTPDQIIEDMNASHPAGGSPVGSQAAYWKFDEGYGTTAHDSNVNQKDGSFQGTVNWANDGKIGKAISLSGSDSNYVLVSDSGSNDTTDLTNKFSLSAWIKINSISSYSSVFFKYLTYALTVFPDGTLRFYGNNNSSWGLKLSSSSGAISTGNWYHVVTTYDSSISLMKLYINGNEAASATVSGDLSPSDDPLRIGRGYPGENGSMNGYIDEAKLYDFALSSEEVKVDYNQGKSLVLGNTGTDSTGVPSQSANRSYCVPGDTSTCNAPIVEYKMDEKTGLTANDSSGNGDHGTLAGYPAWTEGKYGSALNFDGTNDYVCLDDATATCNGSDSNATFDDDFSQRTVELWFKANNTSSSSSQMLYEEGGQTNGANMYIRSGNVYAGVWAESESFSGTWLSSPIDAGVWYHVVSRFDENGSFDLYLNGVLKATSSSGLKMAAHSADDCIGAVCQDTKIDTGYVSSSYGNYFNGEIDNVVFYNYARTPAQIAWDFNKGKPIGWWKMDEGEGTTVHDVSGNGNNATMYNMDASSDWVAGKLNTALDFDGSNDHVLTASVSDPFEYRGEDFSISLWVNQDAGESSEGTIISKPWNAAGVYNYRITLESNDTISFFLSAATSWYTTTTDTIPTDLWTHIVVEVASSSKAVNIYFNGKLVKSDTHNISNWSPSSGDSNIPLSIGTYYPYGDGWGGNSGFSFDGKIDDIRLFNYTLTQQQVNDIYNSGAVNFQGE